MMTMAGSERRLQVSRQVYAIARGVVGLGIVVGLGLVGWQVQRPFPTVAMIRPTLPSPVEPGGMAITVALPDGLFPAALPQTAPAASHPVVVETAVSWRLLGMDLGPPAVALLKASTDGQTVWVKAGDRLGEWTIKQIQSGGVMVEGADGESELRL